MIFSVSSPFSVILAASKSASDEAAGLGAGAVAGGAVLADQFVLRRCGHRRGRVLCDATGVGVDWTRAAGGAL